jgi:asparagine synthase (glutamine-hydrolysing)
MSGVLGVADSTKRLDVCATLDRMTTSMSHREWPVSDHWGDARQGIALGRIGLGIFNPSPQPYWNESHTTAIFMAGEIYAHDGLETSSDGLPDEEIALRLYERLGLEFAGHLNGAFIVALWDQTRNRVVIGNDRFGLYPLFYAYRQGRLLFAPEMKGVLVDPDVPRSLDLTALTQYVRFQHLLGTRTFFEDVQMLAPASVLTFDLQSAECRLHTYWSFTDIAYRPEVCFDEAVEESSRLLRRAVQRRTEDRYRPCVFLTGGLDSRNILGMTRRRPISTWTFGVHGCRDVYYAQKIARAAGSDHHWFDLPNGNWILDHVDEHLELTEGYQSWLHMHGLNMLGDVRQSADVNLTGWDGGTVMGHPDSINPLLSDPVDDNALLTRMFHLFNQAYTWPSLTEEEERLLYPPALGRELFGRAFESFREELSAFLGYRPDVRGEYFFLRHHTGRLTCGIVTMARSQIEVRFPYFDYDLFDFVYSLPAHLRSDHALHRAIIQREHPRLARIPHDKDEFLPTTRRWLRSSHSIGIRFQRRFNRHVRPIFQEHPTLYADYEEYLRHELRPWAEGILFNQRTVERGLFASTFLRTLMDRHVSARERWTVGKIAPLITYEMMLRRFMDR